MKETTMAEIIAGHDCLLALLTSSSSSKMSSVGCNMPDKGSYRITWGNVIGIYNHVINIRSREGRIVSLLSRTGGEEPWALRTNAPSFSELDLAAGSLVASEEGRLVVGRYVYRIKREALPGYEVQPWSGKIKERTAFLRSVSQIRCIVEEHSRTAGPATAYEQRFVRLCDSASEAAARGDKNTVLKAGKGLVGLGPGLTPSGDDWLLGIRAAACIEGNPLQNWTDLFEDICQYASGRTTELSWEFLSRACKGIFHCKVRAFLKAVCQGSDMRETTEALLCTGSTSGLDTVKGLLAGLALHVNID